MTSLEFCKQHSASPAFCKRHGDTSGAGAMCGSASHEELFWIASRPGVLTALEMRAFALHTASLLQVAGHAPQSLVAIEAMRKHCIEDRYFPCTPERARLIARQALHDIKMRCHPNDPLTRHRRVAAWAAWVATDPDPLRAFAKSLTVHPDKEQAAAWLRANTRPNFELQPLTTQTP